MKCPWYSGSKDALKGVQQLGKDLGHDGIRVEMEHGHGLTVLQHDSHVCIDELLECVEHFTHGLF